ncbi:MAG: DUF6069 family protein [Nocardioidaceae bacterium]
MFQLEAEQAEVRRGRWRDDWSVAVTAAGAAALVWCVVTQAASVDLAVRSASGAQEVNVVSVVVTALVAALAGGGLLRVLERRSRRGLTIWSWVAAAVLAVSLVGPLGAVSLSAGVCLALLHVVVGAVVIGLLRMRHAGRVA